MENVYMLTDQALLTRMGQKIRESRLRQNVTQQELAHLASVSLSTLKRIECGASANIDSLLRLLRTLGLLHHIQSLIEEEPLSPSAYEEMLLRQRKRLRKRATGGQPTNEKEEATW